MKRYVIVFLTVLAIIGLDQLTKYMVCESLPLHHQREVVKNFFHIVHVRNPGIAFGLLTQEGAKYRIPMLILVSAVAIFIICYFLYQIKDGSWLQNACFSLLLGGAIGNLIDRFRIGEVIDFLDVHWYSEFHWPAFNVADSAITIGIVLLGLDTLLSMKKKKSEQ
jgi:signal peptidase II